jgi:predicted RNase H-like nuclease
MKKIDMVNAVYDFIQTNVFQLVSKTTVKASQVDLITIGKNMMDKFNILLDGHEIDYVLIENQISPIANRMKTLQGMITQYFIMKHVPRIEFISAANKLKYFVNKKTTYDERKKLGIEITKNILQKNIFKNQWMEILDKSKKKDDLADSLLQGLWYMITKQMIDKKLLQ